MKLYELKQSNLGMKLPDLSHIKSIGGIAYRMGINRSANPQKIGHGFDAWTKGWDDAKREFEALLARNGCDGVRRQLWM